MKTRLPEALRTAYADALRRQAMRGERFNSAVSVRNDFEKQT